MKFLLKDPKNRVDPSVPDNEPIICACKFGNLSAAKLLLSDKRVDPGAKDNECIKLAAKGDHLEVVKFLCECSRVDPTKALETSKGKSKEYLLSRSR